MDSEQQEKLNILQQNPIEEKFWQAVIAFQGYPFKTATSLPFRY